MNGPNLPPDFAAMSRDGTATINPVSSEPEWIDDALHYGRAWHRFRYCYRGSRPLRVLDAGCGMGRSSAWIARLNPGATVLGVDLSPTSIAAARQSSKARACSPSTLEFQAADLLEPLPEALGTFDFVVCRKLLGEASDPARILQNLAKALKPDGLLYLDLPSKRGRQAARALRRVVDVIALPGMLLEERPHVALRIFQGLRSDHPLKIAIQERVGSDPERMLVDFLIETRAWSFDEASSLIEGAGLRLLHAVNPVGWTPDQVFNEQALDNGLGARLQELDPSEVSALVDALDPSPVRQDFQIYACPLEFQPSVPSWPSKPMHNHEAIDRLIPHPTGIARPLEYDGRAFSAGSVIYQTVSGAVGELDRLSNLMFLASDGRSSIGDINFRLAAQTRASDDEQARRNRWINLADSGFIVLQPPELAP